MKHKTNIGRFILTHTFADHSGKRKKNGQWELTRGPLGKLPANERLLYTGSSVAVLRALRKLYLEIPIVMSGPSAFSQEYTVEWEVIASAP